MASTRGKQRSNRSGTRSRREQKSRDQSCSVSSQEEDFTDCGYSSNETLRLYEKEIRNAAQKNHQLGVAPQQMENKETQKRINSLRNLPDVSCTNSSSRHLPDVSCNGPSHGTRPRSNGSDGSHDSHCSSHGSRPGSNGSDGDVETDTNSMTPDQLIEEANSYLQDTALDELSLGGATHSSRSSLTLTETEMEPDSPFHSPAPGTMSGFNGLSTMPLSKPPPPPFKIDPSMSSRARNRSPITNSDLNRLQDELANGHPAGYDMISPSDVSMIQNGTPNPPGGRASSSGYETVETSNLSNVSQDRTFPRNGRSVSPLGPQLVPYATNEIYSSNSVHSCGSMDRRRELRPVESPALYEAIQLQSHPSQNSMNSRPSLYYSGGSVETAFMAPSPITHQDPNSSTLRHTGLITNPAILLQQQGGGRPLPSFNNNQTIVRQDGDCVNTYSTLNAVNTNSRTATGTFFEFPFGTPTMTNATMQSNQGAPPQAQQGFTPGYNDKHPGEQLKYRRITGKYVCKDRLTWKCSALILALIILMLLGILAYFAAVSVVGGSCPVHVGNGINSTDPAFPSNKGPSAPTPTRPTQVQLGAPIQSQVPAGRFVVTEMQIDTPQYVQFNLSVPKQSHFALYGSRGTTPSHTTYDFVQVYAGDPWSSNVRTRRGAAKAAAPAYARSSKANSGRRTSYKDVLRTAHRTSKREAPFQDGMIQIVKRSNEVERGVLSFVRHLDAGTWYIGMFNDGTQTEDVNLSMDEEVDWAENCPRGCSGHGVCIDGDCVCHPHYTGEDCSQDVCPVLCKGHGYYYRGQCECFVGWKGVECDIPQDQCLVPNCNGHGVCHQGECLCYQGFKGEACEQADCSDPTCSGNGICQRNQCYCTPGYTGSTCNRRVPAPAQPQATTPSSGLTNLATDSSSLATTSDPGSITPVWGKIPGCSMDCSLHGYYDPGRAMCMCDIGWTGRACEQESLECTSDLDCGEHATCDSGLCLCDLNWTGTDCSEPICDLPCSFHGQCVNSSCICEAGWNGRLCGLEGCPLDCSGNGGCQMIGDIWQCVCQSGYQGNDCSIQKETSCSDGRDNDDDDLIDCQDPDCCVNNLCQSHSLCQTVPDPRELLLHLQEDNKPMTLSFYDNVQFLIGVGSVQKGVTMGTVEESWASVICGKVKTLEGTPLPGVMVRVDKKPEYGYTTSRPDGMFDIMVEGRGALQLLFDREPFFRSTQSVYIGRNQFVTLDDVSMISATGDYVENKISIDCNGDEFPVPEIKVLPSVGGEGTTCKKTGIIVDEQSVHEQIPIPGTTLTLDYLSHLAVGRLARVILQLVGPSIPLKLEMIHVRITLEGKVFEDLVLPESNLQYSFVWDKENVYDQPVYGRTVAIVSVGYEYQGCASMLWSKRPVSIEGHQWSTAALGGWQLPIHHSYNHNKASLHMGTGQSIYFRDHAPTITAIMGDGTQRSNECDNCEGKAENSAMLAPTALAYTPDGSLFVGDYNFIRKIGPDGNATNIVRLGYNPSYKYYLAASPLDGSVYFSDGQTRQIYRLRSLSGMADVTDNLIVVAGSGEPCLPSDENRCGDGGPADQAKLLDPKGITVSKDGTIYFVDGTVIRQVKKDGTISTFLGTPNVIGPARVPRCLTTMPLDKVSLQWPTEICINPIDDSIHVLDEKLVLKLTLDGQASVVAGMSYNCPVVPDPEPRNYNASSKLGHKMANQETLDSPSAIAFSSSGDLYIAETDYLRVHRVRKVTPDGAITWFVGTDSECDCFLADCVCYAGDNFQALSAKLQVPIAMATSQHNELFIADQGNLRVRKVSPTLPTAVNGQYKISSPDREQHLTFDSKGQHVITRDALTEINVFTFNYTTAGRLEFIRDGSGNMFTIERNRAGIPFKMMSSNVEVLRLITDAAGFLTEVAGNNGNLIIQLGYHGNTGLLATRHDGGVLRSVFEYNQFGLLRTAKWPTGHVTKLRTSLNTTHAAITLSRTGLLDVVTTKTHTGWATTQVNRQEGEVNMITTYTDGFSAMSYANGLMAEIETKDHPLFEEDVQGVIAKRKVLLPEELVHRLEWRFYARRSGRNKEKILIVGRKLRVNGENVFTLEYNRYTRTERLQNTDGIPVLVINHDASSGLPTEWLPMHGLKPTNATYDVHGRLVRWQRGLFFEAYSYDNKGRMTMRSHGSGNWQYHYQQGDKPTTVTVPGDLPGGRQYRLSYDAASHLATVTMPNNIRHFVKTILSLGYTRNCYSIETNSAWLVQDFSHSGQPIQVYYMGTGRKVNYLYDNSDQLSDIIFGMTLVNHKYFEESGQVQTIELIDGSFSNTLEYTYNGPLVAHHSVRTRGFDGLVFAQFDYTYDPTMRVASITAEFNATTMPVWEAKYDGPTGRIVQISGFTVTYPDVKVRIISDADSDSEARFRLEKQYGDYALLQNIRYSILNVNMVTMDLLYDITQRVAQRTISVQNLPETVRYQYDAAGQLEEVFVDEQSVWRYTYTPNGNLATVQRGNNLTRLEYDEQDRITSVGSVDYQLDADGFLFKRGEESFEYNSYGQLIHAYQPRVYDVRYKYDGLGRPLWRRDHTGRQVQFFYADMTESWRVTHIYDHATHELWTLEYDLQGFLFSIKQNQRQIYISTDQSGSPIAVFNDAGRLLKLIRYNPMGSVISDSDPNFVLYIGFHGGIYDPFTRLVHINGRDYDPFSGRWTSPSVQFYTEITKTSKTTLFNLYTFNGNNPVNKDLHINYLMDMWSWLPLLGYDVNGMAPTVGCSGELLAPGLQSSYMRDWRSTYKQHQPSTSIDCQARTNLQTLYSNFHTFPLPHLSSDVTTQQYKDTGFTRLPPPTGSGVLPTLENGKVVPVILGDADDASYKLAEVLQDAVVLERLRNTEGGRDVRFFVKLGEEAAEQDLTTLGIELDESTVEVELSSAVTVVGQREPGDEATLMLRINTDTTIWDVYYGLTVEEAIAMVLADAKEIAVQQAWDKEKQAILAGRRGSRNWTVAQEADIREIGRVPGFEGQYTLDPTKYPEIAFDGNSIRL